MWREGPSAVSLKGRWLWSSPMISSSVGLRFIRARLAGIDTMAFGLICWQHPHRSVLNASSSHVFAYNPRECRFSRGRGAQIKAPTWNLGEGGKTGEDTAGKSGQLIYW